LDEFENDPRFTKLCRVLGRSVNLRNGNNNNNNTGRTANKISGFRTDDLNIVLGVTGDDEAAKLVATITVPQMVRVFKNLAAKKQRSTPLLRSLSFNMSSNEEHLDLKQCADVLYALASLNFPDPVLIVKICEDIQERLKEPLEKSSVIGSIITSLALLKYRDPVILDVFCDWIVKNREIARPQDISAVFKSLGNLNYLPAHHEEVLGTKLAQSLSPLEFKSSLDYLNYVWSLMVLNFPHSDFFNSVLSKDFIEKITKECVDLPVSAKLKLLNINAGVKLFLPTYNGSMLSRDNHKTIYDVPIVHNKEKQLLINGMSDAIKSVVPEKCLKLNQDSNMGFLIGKIKHNELMTTFRNSNYY
jgi:hypothetical protein